MGTRCLTKIYDGDGKTCLMCMYRQYDGYPTGHGQDLKDLLAGSEIVNGFGSREGLKHNGMGCLAASVVAHFKDGIGGFYLEPVDTEDMGQCYTYILYERKRKVYVRVIKDCYDGEKKALYEGPIDELDTEECERNE